MRHASRIALFLVVSLGVGASGASAAEPVDAAAAVWKRYLGAAEQATLAEFQAASSEGPSAEGGDADPKAMLAGMRDGFARFIAMVAPPPDGIPQEEFSEGAMV